MCRVINVLSLFVVSRHKAPSAPAVRLLSFVCHPNAAEVRCLDSLCSPDYWNLQKEEAVMWVDLEDGDRVELTERTGGKPATFTATDLMAEVSDTEVLCCAVQPHKSICYQCRVAMAFTDALLSTDAASKKVRCQTSTCMSDGQSGADNKIIPS